ncbi:ribonuclease III [Uliginosibacterium aquaticum]|uniref:ribonuclease III n=1 Tax=Uliginosibacterium aquaticum TaxID=2731212 RepID=UPI001F1D380F|nr:ribonuclease III [Uliginosibacterium aquaticum]
MSESSLREALIQALGHAFRQPALLRQALTHSSYAADNNERLEFLGDSIVDMVVSMLLFERFPALREGELSRLRAQFVKQDALHEIALDLNLGESLLLGEGEHKSGGRQRPSILADALEAVFGAIYLDGGFEAVKGVIERLYANKLVALDPAKSLKDPKTALQEILQARRLGLPRYELVAERGLAHAREFEISCVVEPLGLLTQGIGSSRRIAEQQAARAALQELEKQ